MRIHVEMNVLLGVVRKQLNTDSMSRSDGWNRAGVDGKRDASTYPCGTPKKSGVGNDVTSRALTDCVPVRLIGLEPS
jgi:hypothetical protein